VVLAHFPESASGGFFFTSDDHEKLIYRSKSFSDDAIPAGNGIAAFVMQRMGHLLGESRYLAAEESTLHAAWKGMEQYPHAHTSLLAALEELLRPPEIVILRGKGATIENWRIELAKLYAPHRIVFAVPAEARDLPIALSAKPAGGTAVAYICRGSTCSASIDSLAELAQALRSGVA
jgi:uncharacterized protein